MHFQQYYLACLSHASYLIGDTTTGRAVVVDPQRDVTRYLEDAAAAGLTIERVIETHFHADFLSGHLELRRATGAAISYGTVGSARTEFATEPLEDGRRLELGRVVLEIRDTPGHTPESISIVVWERDGDPVPYGVLTGDTLFIGDVGRPDLLSAFGESADGLARKLYRSLHERLLTLPDATRVFPAHGAGSACGKHLSTETVSTIGEQRRTNYALAPMSEDEFVRVVTEGQAAAPLYFSFAATRNREAREAFDEAGSVPTLALESVLAARDAGAVLLDVREPADFALAHLRGSVNVGLSGRFAEYAGEVIRSEQRIVLVGAAPAVAEARTRLARIGFDRVDGALVDPEAAFVARPDEVAVASRLTAAQVAERMATVPDLQVVDVRGPGETANGTIEGARLVQLPTLLARAGELDPARPTLVYCAGGYRSSIAASTLRRLGFADVSDLVGGYGAWAERGVRA
ncbi:MAG: MBL fold metallo-hydrolase [Ilumatobacteraceae bacterium]|jgi:glyoxylase-like metal-dependent hydrolase (beta-lactamase superfamily II)/rhodanese-related sulfurtransferase